MPPIENYLSTSEAADVLGYKKQYVANLCQSGGLVGAVKIANRWFIPRASVEGYTPGPQGFAAKKAPEQRPGAHPRNHAR